MLSNTVKRSFVTPITSTTGVALNTTCKLSSIAKTSTTKRLINTAIKSNESKPIKSKIQFQQNQKLTTAAAVAPQEKEEEDYENAFIGMTGGEILHEMLKRHNVKHVFGYPGGAILPIMDAIYETDQFEFVLPRHEQGAGHMAEGYARASGNVGVAIVTSGPGATNIITPLQDAYSDGIPMVVFSGQVPNASIGTDAFQEADVVGISRACTKWNCMVKDIRELPRRINEAFHIATSGRPGPVLIDLPKDVTAGVLKKPINGMQVSIPSIRSLNQPVPNQKAIHSIERAAKLINNAKRPVIYAGAGLLNHPDGPKILNELVEKSNIPVTTTLQGLGVYDEEKPLALHMLGMHGSVYANLAIQKADVILALGVRFDDRVTGKVSEFAPKAKEAALEKRGAVVGDVTENLELMLPMIKKNKRTEWVNTVINWKKKYPFTYKKSEPGKPMKPQEVIEELNRQLKDKKDDVIISTGVGQHQMWAAQYFRWRKPRSIVSSGGLGTMGFGLPSCIGAKVAKPEKTVIDIDGDSSLSMTMMELATAGQYQIGVKILLLNNSYQGMVKQWQDLFYNFRHSGTKMTNPDFVKVAEAMRLKGLRCTDKKDLPAKIKEFLETDKPVLLDVTIDENEHVLPMVPAGKALHEMELGSQTIDEEDLNM
ncbi:acetolactate synthase mitochondrial precursor [Neocallimastix californiae]|uniref:Acetolactate synthase n=1 Tax=Neocallimastix californiae TaxID=1754190 RepID=A0A1Y2FB54_9FUNG|nr:acetolactate synthase mitochondrial precursor [Neocallimastix californiae]|eukprot:ORY81148.1 acetolactate synthase mitochondrial precursor [Neocallimastix californiae]